MLIYSEYFREIIYIGWKILCDIVFLRLFLFWQLEENNVMIIYRTECICESQARLHFHLYLVYTQKIGVDKLLYKDLRKHTTYETEISSLTSWQSTWGDGTHIHRLTNTHWRLHLQSHILNDDHYNIKHE